MKCYGKEIKVINKNILDHYLQFSSYTNPGCYLNKLRNDFPDQIREIGLLVRKQLIHRVCLKNGNKWGNADLKYGDMTKVPWYRQAEDDLFPTASAILAELFRRDERGFIMDRQEKNRLILTCRFASILMAAILKSKGIPCRCRCGFAPYFRVFGNTSEDHWINQYWDKNDKRWVTIDVDGSLEDYLKFDPYDMKENIFDFSADAWLGIRNGKLSAQHFHDAAGWSGLITVGWQVFHDFHALMNNELLYQHGPKYGWGRMDKLTEDELKEIDKLALLLQNPDDNFDELKNIWENKQKFRILKGGLL